MTREERRAQLYAELEAIETNRLRRELALARENVEDWKGIARRWKWSAFIGTAACFVHVLVNAWSLFR